MPSVLKNGQIIEVPEWDLRTEAERQADATALQATSVRQQRDVLLNETDWHALSDSTLTTDMAAYRQALRDVPNQAGFPDTIIWPNKP
jgi:hypothetical protein